MSASRKYPNRRPLGDIIKGYDRIVSVYSTFEPLFLIFPPARRKAVAALNLKGGDVVLEIGAGTGRNLPYLIDAVGPDGTVIAVDASEGMLAEASKLVERYGWPNVFNCSVKMPRNYSSIATLMACSSASATQSSRHPVPRWHAPGSTCVPHLESS
jgi:SAM-dependent methyltransferase